MNKTRIQQKFTYVVNKNICGSIRSVCRAERKDWNHSKFTEIIQTGKGILSTHFFLRQIYRHIEAQMLQNENKQKSQNLKLNVEFKTMLKCVSFCFHIHANEVQFLTNYTPFFLQATRLLSLQPKILPKN